MARLRSEKYQDPKGPAWPIFVRLLKIAWRFRRYALLLIALAAFGIGLEIVQVKYLGTGITKVEELGRDIQPQSLGGAGFFQTMLHPPSEFLREITKVALIILALAIVRGINTFITQVGVTNFRERVVWRLRAQVFSALQRLSFGYYDRNYSGQIINRATGDVQRIRGFIANVWYNTAQTILYLVGYIGLMLSINWLLTLASVALLPIAGLLMYRLARQLRPAYRRAREKEDELITALQENISGVFVVKAFTRQQGEIEKFERLSDELYDRVMLTVDLFRRYMPLIRSTLRLNQVAILGLGGLLVLRGHMSIGDLVVFTTAAAVISGRIGIIMDLTNMIQEAIASAERVFEVLDARPDVREKRGARPLPAGNGHVVFEDVQFGYVKDKPVLNGINLEIEAGEVVGIGGPTGSGKTTLLMLLPRFYDPDHGRVLIDGADLRDVQLQSLRSSIGLVFQESFLFNDTVANNIAFGAPQASMEEIIRAAKIAKAHDFIMEMEHGYETIIGERGETLSGGQRQRIALARALIKDPRILILDDAFASVDAETEHEIVDALDEILKGRTVFIISHRVSILRRTHRIVVLDEGRIVQTGSHEELMAQPGVYRRTAMLQLQETSEQTMESILHDEIEDLAGSRWSEPRK